MGGTPLALTETRRFSASYARSKVSAPTLRVVMRRVYHNSVVKRIWPKGYLNGGASRELIFANHVYADRGRCQLNLLGLYQFILRRK